MKKIFLIVLYVVLIFLPLRTWSEKCQPTFETIKEHRGLPDSYVDQGLASLPKIYPKHELLLQRRSSSIGEVQYSLLVFKEDSNSNLVTIEGIAVRHPNAWSFQTKCLTGAAMEGLVITLERISMLGNAEK